MNTLTTIKHGAVAALFTTFLFVQPNAFAAPPSAAVTTPVVTVLAPVIVTGTRFTASEKIRLAQIDRRAHLASTNPAPHKS